MKGARHPFANDSGLSGQKIRIVYKLHKGWLTGTFLPAEIVLMAAFHGPVG
jgi:hypothetical protein